MATELFHNIQNVFKNSERYHNKEEMVLKNTISSQQKEIKRWGFIFRICSLTKKLTDISLMEIDPHSTYEHLKAIDSSINDLANLEKMSKLQFSDTEVSE